MSRIQDFFRRNFRGLWRHPEFMKLWGSLTITSAVRGLFKTNPATRAEALSLVTRSGGAPPR